MKTASAGLIAHLTSGQQFRRAELWTFTLANATVVRYTTLDVDVTIAGTTWLAGGPVLSRPASRLVTGVQVGEFEVTVEPVATDTIAGLPWVQAARLGLLRYGRLRIERIYMPSWGDVTLGKLHLMGGRMAAAHGDGSQVLITVRDDRELLNTKIPLHLVQPGCRHTLFAAGCTLNPASWAVSGTVAAGSGVSTVLATLAQAGGWFSLGRIIFTGGINSGTSRSIKQHTAGSPAALSLISPLPVAPAPGDTFTLYPGCDKQQATCNSKFGNVLNFGGQPYVPQPETAL